MSALVVLLLLGLVALAVAVARAPVTERHLEAYVRRHRLEVTDGDRPQLVAYLAHTRRWRAAGAVGGCLVGVVSALPEGRFAVGIFPTLAGWFAGAVVAELRSGREGEPGPAWLLRVPYVLVVVTVGAALLGGQWGWGAGGVAIAVAAIVAGRRGTMPAVGVITGAACALVVWCAVDQLSALDGRVFDAVATAVGGIGLLWTGGGLVVAVGLAVRPSLVRVLVVAGLLVVTSAGWFGYAWWKDRPPYPAAAVRATATVRLTSQGRFERDARDLGITGLNGLADEPGAQQFIGRVDHVVPARADGTLHVLVIDKQGDQVAPELYGAAGGGWNGFMSKLADRYSWLSATAPTVTDGGLTFQGSEVSAEANAGGPMTFLGRFRDRAGMPLSDLMVVLVLSGPDNQIYWATPVTG